MQVLKQRVSRQLRGKKMRGTKNQLLRPFGTKEALPRQFWQRRFHDFNVWSHKKKMEKLLLVPRSCSGTHPAGKDNFDTCISI
jgi:hypothetical protein